MTDDEMKKYREKTILPDGWNIEDAERSTCQYVLLKNREYYVVGYGETKKEAMKAALRKIRKGKLKESHPGLSKTF